MQHAIDSKPKLLTIIAAIVIAVLTVPVILLLLLFMTLGFFTLSVIEALCLIDATADIENVIILVVDI